MAGVKGRSGGPRKNAGGKRAGAGRKPKAGAVPKSANAPAPATIAVDGATRDPLEFLELVMNDPKVDIKQRIRAGIAAAQYRHTKRHDGGKKEEADEKAGKAAKGRFSVRKPPSLKVVGG